MPTERKLADFAGRWHLDRTIAQADGQTGRFEGQAVFTADAAGALAYLEDGTLTLGTAAPMHATRRYVWRAGLDVFFEDGRFFHTVPAGGGAAVHHCAPDTYRVRYDFAAWPDWTAEWQVQGPRKDYTMISRYRPVP